jgi:predicted transcriptional regulator
MGKPFPIVKHGTPEEVSKLFTKENEAVLVELENGKHHIITKYDIIGSINNFFCHKSSKLHSLDPFIWFVAFI